MNRERYFADPEKMPAEERKYWFKVRNILEGLLNDLKERNCLRRATQEETLHFIALMKDKDEIAMSLNMLGRYLKMKKD